MYATVAGVRPEGRQGCGQGQGPLVPLAREIAPECVPSPRAPTNLAKRLSKDRRQETLS